MKRKVYLHIGYPKTATSALQKQVFPNINGLSYLGKCEIADRKYSYDCIEQLLLDAATLPKGEFSKLNVPPLERREGKVLLSEEVFLFNLFRPTLWRKGGYELDDMIENIKFIELKWNVRFHLIVTVRRQVDMIPSIYAQAYNSCYSRLDMTKTLSGFLKFIFEDTAIWKNLDYSAVYTRLNKNFDVVDVVVYEISKTAKEDFLSSFAEILEVDLSGLTLKSDNVRESGGYRNVGDYTLSDLLGSIRHRVPFLRHIRLPVLRDFLHKFSLKRMENISREISLSDDEYNYIVDKYRVSNSEFSSLSGKDLATYGYFSRR